MALRKPVNRASSVSENSVSELARSLMEFTDHDGYEDHDGYTRINDGQSIWTDASNFGAYARRLNMGQRFVQFFMRGMMAMSLLLFMVPLLIFVIVSFSNKNSPFSHYNNTHPHQSFCKDSTGHESRDKIGKGDFYGIGYYCSRGTPGLCFRWLFFLIYALLFISVFIVVIVLFYFRREFHPLRSRSVVFSLIFSSGVLGYVLWACLGLMYDPGWMGLPLSQVANNTLFLMTIGPYWFRAYRIKVLFDNACDQFRAYYAGGGMLLGGDDFFADTTGAGQGTFALIGSAGTPRSVVPPGSVFITPLAESDRPTARDARSQRENGPRPVISSAKARRAESLARTALVVGSAPSSAAQLLAMRQAAVAPVTTPLLRKTDVKTHSSHHSSDEDDQRHYSIHSVPETYQSSQPVSSGLSEALKQKGVMFDEMRREEDSSQSGLTTTTGVSKSERDTFMLTDFDQIEVDSGSVNNSRALRERPPVSRRGMFNPAMLTNDSPVFKGETDVIESPSPMIANPLLLDDSLTGLDGTAMSRMLSTDSSRELESSGMADFDHAFIDGEELKKERAKRPALFDSLGRAQSMGDDLSDTEEHNHHTMSQMNNQVNHSSHSYIGHNDGIHRFNDPEFDDDLSTFAYGNDNSSDKVFDSKQLLPTKFKRRLIQVFVLIVTPVIVLTAASSANGHSLFPLMFIKCHDNNNNKKKNESRIIPFLIWISINSFQALGLAVIVPLYIRNIFHDFSVKKELLCVGALEFIYCLSLSIFPLAGEKTGLKSDKLGPCCLYLLLVRAIGFFTLTMTFPVYKTFWKAKLPEIPNQFVISSLDSVLENPEAITYFHRFMSEYNCEYLLNFWMEILYFKEMCAEINDELNDIMILSQSNQIYRKYFGRCLDQSSNNNNNHNNNVIPSTKTGLSRNDGSGEGGLSMDRARKDIQRIVGNEECASLALFFENNHPNSSIRGQHQKKEASQKGRKKKKMRNDEQGWDDSGYEEEESGDESNGSKRHSSSEYDSEMDGLRDVPFEYDSGLKIGQLRKDYSADMEDMRRHHHVFDNAHRLVFDHIDRRYYRMFLSSQYCKELLAALQGQEAIYEKLVSERIL